MALVSLVLRPLLSLSACRPVSGAPQPPQLQPRPRSVVVMTLSPDSSGLSISVADSSPSPVSSIAREKVSMIGAESSIVGFWVRHRLFSADRVERHYAFLISMLLASTLLFSLLKPDGPLWLWGSPKCSLWAAGLILSTLGNVWAEQQERWGAFEVTRGIQFLLAMLSVLIYYGQSKQQRQAQAKPLRMPVRC